MGLIPTKADQYRKSLYAAVCIAYLIVLRILVCVRGGPRASINPNPIQTLPLPLTSTTTTRQFTVHSIPQLTSRPLHKHPSYQSCDGEGPEPPSSPHIVEETLIPLQHQSPTISSEEPMLSTRDSSRGLRFRHLILTSFVGRMVGGVISVFLGRCSSHSRMDMDMWTRGIRICSWMRLVSYSILFVP